MRVNILTHILTHSVELHACKIIVLLIATSPFVIKCNICVARVIFSVVQ